MNAEHGGVGGKKEKTKENEMAMNLIEHQQME